MTWNSCVVFLLCATLFFFALALSHRDSDGFTYGQTRNAKHRQFTPKNGRQKSELMDVLWCTRKEIYCPCPKKRFLSFLIFTNWNWLFKVFLLFLLLLFAPLKYQFFILFAFICLQIAFNCSQPFEVWRREKKTTSKLFFFTVSKNCARD